MADDTDAPDDAAAAAASSNAANLDDTSVRAQLGDHGLDELENIPSSSDAKHSGSSSAAATASASASASSAINAGPKLEAWKQSGSYGKFIGITPFFNPGRHQNKVDNFRRFRASVAAQGLQMLCVELVFGHSTPFQLRDAAEAAAAASEANPEGDAASSSSSSSSAAADCDILVRRRTRSEQTMWQKERLLNIALENLPRTVDKVMWLDSDLIFLNDDWVPETAELLDRFPVVQPFGWMTYLPHNEGADYAVEQLPSMPLGMGVGSVYHSAGLGVQSFPDRAFQSNFLLGHPGFAWAARREVITAAGFYDRSIIGGGDRIMLNGFTGHYVGVSRKMPPAMAADVRAFGAKLTPLVGPSNISYTPGVVLHIWHGNVADRDYTHRYQILLDNRYDPKRDIKIGPDGVLQWSSQKPALHRQVTEYFNNRKEGPKPNKTQGGANGGGDDAWTASRKSLSRPVRSFLSYHCGRADYRASCKVAFKLWGDALRATQLQLVQKKLREEQAAAIAAAAAGREAAQKRSREKAKNKNWKRKGKKNRP